MGLRTTAALRVTIYRIGKELAFPAPEEAEPSGLLGVGGDLGPSRLVLAYSMGIFPWYSEELPILWFSPDPRAVLPVESLHVGRSLRKRLRQRPFRVTLDGCFDRVIRSASRVPRRRQHGTWITPDMIRAYEGLHRLGLAHSVECWEGEELVGGLYGVSLGGVFFGESMFSLRPDGSKVALSCLVRQLDRWGFHLVDCQLPTPHLASLGAQEWPRRKFLERLAEALRGSTRRGPWSFDGDPYSPWA
jgi:leucyl/phenylalanyl-tRNA--protein transferase